MRLVIATGPNLPVPAIRGGAVNRFWSQMGPALVRQGVQVTICARADRNQTPSENVEGVRYYRCGGFDSMGIREYDYVRSLLYAFRMWVTLPKADLYILNDAFSPLLAGLCRRGNRTVVAVGRAPKGQFRWFSRRLHFVAPTSEIKRRIVKEAPHLEACCKVLPYAIDYNRLASTDGAAAGNTDRDARLLYAGRIHPEKGIGLLVSAFRQFHEVHPNFRLSILGPWLEEQGGGGNAYRREMQREAKGLPVDWLEPEFDFDRLSAYYRSAQYFVYPSLATDGETFGVAPLEAMACGAIPIVSGLECFDDFIQAGQNGFRFSHRVSDAAGALAKAMCAAVASDAQRLSLAATDTARQYSIDTVSRQWFDYLSTLVRS